jgi:hypothetical protein
MTANQVSAGRWLGAAGAALVLAACGTIAVTTSRAPAAPATLPHAPVSHTSAAPATPSHLPAAPTASSARAPAAAPAAARMARVLNVDDTGHLRLLNASGSILQEEGPASGTFPGNVKVRLVVRAAVTASFTIAPGAGGSISGRGSATLHSTLRYSSFGGSLTVEHGTGRYAHAHGSGRLYGVIDRRTDALVVQTTGQLDY